MEAVAPNLCLQQMVTVVTVRAKHGPRQPRPLLKLVLGWLSRFESRHAASGRVSLASLRNAIATEWRRITVTLLRRRMRHDIGPNWVFLAQSRRLFGLLSRSGYCPRT